MYEPNRSDDPDWPATVCRSLAITEEGIVCGAGSILARMGDCGVRLALDADRERLLALLSVAHRRLVTPDILAAIAAAADHWRRGDRALANLRLVFSELPHLSQPADAYRMRLAEYLLDEGMMPSALLKELGLGRSETVLAKYNPDQPRVPAGNGRRSGEWDFGGSGSTPDIRTGRIVVAIEADPPDDKPPHNDRPGQLPEDEHGFQLNPLPGLPLPGGKPIPIGGETSSEPSPTGPTVAPSIAPSQSSVSGSRRVPLVTPAGAPPVNDAGTFNGVPYSGHAFDQMQNRGIPPSVTDQAIQTGTPTPSQRYPGTVNLYDPENNVTVVRDGKTGKVITVFPGKSKP